MNTIPDVENKMTLEEAFTKLEQITRRMEDKNLPLDDSFKLYEEGMRLITFCNQQIDTVEKKIIQIRGEQSNVSI